jgi:hypothetical protein
MGVACVTLSSSITARESPMSLESHLVELERRHQAMESAIAAEKLHPGTDDLKLIELKRKKLLLKDEIEKLRQEKLLATAH